MGKRRFATQGYDTINLTPLIDTLFFLLIIFMVTAPLLEYSVDVSTPEMNADEIPQDDPNVKTVNLKKEGLVVFDHKEYSKTEFFNIIPELKSNPKAKIYLRADKGLSYGDVIQFLAGVKSAGFNEIFLVTSEEANE